MCSTPNLRNFKALMNLLPPSPFELIVTGEVETNAGNMLPFLTKSNSPGANPRQLVVDLNIKSTGSGGTQDVSFRPTRYEQSVIADQFDSVAILWGNEPINVLSVEEVN